MSKSRRQKSAQSQGIEVEFHNETSLPSDYVIQLFRWVMRFLRNGNFRGRRKIALYVKPMSDTQAKTKSITGYQLDDRVVVQVNQDPDAYPLNGVHSKYKDLGFPEFALEDVTDALVAILTHELAHWCGCDGDRGGEFMCEVLSSAAVTSHRLQRQRQIDSL